jgi:hypothetical protein
MKTQWSVALAMIALALGGAYAIKGWMGVGVVVGAVIFGYGLNALLSALRRLRAPKGAAADLRPIVMGRGMRYVVPGLVGEWRVSEVTFTISGLSDDVEARLTMRRVRP